MKFWRPCNWLPGKSNTDARSKPFKLCSTRLAIENSEVMSFGVSHKLSPLGYQNNNYQNNTQGENTGSWNPEELAPYFQNIFKLHDDVERNPILSSLV